MKQKIIAAFCLFFPPCTIKNIILVRLFGWKVAAGVRIGFSYIDSKKVVIGKLAVIGNGNRFHGLKEVLISSNAVVSRGNKFVASRKIPCSGYLYVGENSCIVSSHLFDLTGGIKIGKCVTIAGQGSQFWTHGFDLAGDRMQGEIKIGDGVYIGSRVMLSPGVSVCDKVSIGMGSVVTKNLDDMGFFYCGVPARSLKRAVFFSRDDRYSFSQSYQGQDFYKIDG